jgi:hypothetical protein
MTIIIRKNSANRVIKEPPRIVENESIHTTEYVKRLQVEHKKMRYRTEVLEKVRKIADAVNKNWNEFGPDGGHDELQDCLYKALAEAESLECQH